MTMVRDLKLVPAPDPRRKELASAISMHAGAARDLIVAEQAAAAAKQKWWNAEARLDELRKEAPSPGGYLSDDAIAMIASGAACDTDVLDRSAVEAGARMKAFENDSKVWKAASAQCDLAVKAKAESAVTAKERLDRAARMVVCNSENVAKLIDALETKQVEIIEMRSALRFISSRGCNGELAPALSKQIERVLLQDLSGLGPTDSYRAWDAAFNELLANSDAALPNEG